jgi:hypothetical protein
VRVDQNGYTRTRQECDAGQVDDHPRPGLAICCAAQFG